MNAGETTNEGRSQSCARKVKKIERRDPGAARLIVISILKKVVPTFSETKLTY